MLVPAMLQHALYNWLRDCLSCRTLRCDAQDAAAAAEKREKAQQLECQRARAELLQLRRQLSAYEAVSTSEPEQQSSVRKGTRVDAACQGDDEAAVGHCSPAEQELQEQVKDLEDRLGRCQADLATAEAIGHTATTQLQVRSDLNTVHWPCMSSASWYCELVEGSAPQHTGMT
jgi:type II secretory pathway component HofQ